jgi:hypothetical protein
MRPPTQTRWENLQEILTDLSARGVEYRLHGGTFQYRDRCEVLTPEQDAALDVIRPGLSGHLRRRQGLCIACGLEAATRPNYRGMRRNISDEAKSTCLDLRYGVPHWQDEPEWQDLGEAYAPLWCRARWDAGRWKEL